MKKLNVYSEIGKLNKVLVHMPGDELLHLTPDWLDDLLFDDIPWLKRAQEEHLAFQESLRQQGVEVIQLIDIMSEILVKNEIKDEFIEQFMNESDINNQNLRLKVKTYLNKLSNGEFMHKVIAGILKTDISPMRKHHLKDYISDYPFITDPMPNLYFTRDPFTIIGNDVSLHRMHKKNRQRESIFGQFLLKYHPYFNEAKTLYHRDEIYPIEGGDILNINEDVLLIGLSERTHPDAIELLAKNLFSLTNYKNVLAILLPKKRTFMHLDTVFTQVDYYHFVVHPALLGSQKIYEIHKDLSFKKGYKITETSNSLKSCLKKFIKHEITLIPCGGKNNISADREQWNDGANVFAVKPGVVIAYDRNDLTNQKLVRNGITVIEIPSSELSRGRGGPRCMTMPLNRSSIK